jgi:ATP-dependent helicase HrpA
VIASALSVQDVRDRPMDAQQQADQAHAKFDDEKSEFTGYLKLWKWITRRAAVRPRCPRPGAEGPPARARCHAVLPVAQRARAGGLRRAGAAGQGPVPPAAAHPTHKLSNRQYDNCCARTSSTCAACASGATSTPSCTPWWPSTNGAQHHCPPATSSCTCPCWPACWATSAARWSEEARFGWRVSGCAGHQVLPHPGAHLSKKPGRWIVAAELVETTRLFGRGIAAIEPQWLEQVGGHLLKKQLLDPHWEKKAAEVTRWSGPRCTASSSTAGGAPITAVWTWPARARSSFARRWWPASGKRQAAVSGGQPEADRQVEELEHKARRQDVLVDDELIYAFYDQQLPPMCAAATALSAGTAKNRASPSTPSCC